MRICELKTVTLTVLNLSIIVDFQLLFWELWNARVPDTQKCDVPERTVILSMIPSVILLLACIAGIHGVYVEKGRFLIPYLFLLWILTLFSFLMFVKQLVTQSQTDQYKVNPVKLAFLAGFGSISIAIVNAYYHETEDGRRNGYVFKGYLWLIVFSYYKEMADEKQTIAPTPT